MEIICFYLGVLFYYTTNNDLLAVVFILVFIHPRLLSLLLFGCGIFLATIHQSLYSSHGMPPVSTIPSAVIEGSIASIPQVNAHKTQFVFSLARYNNQPAKGLIQLAWYNNAPSLQAGQQWRIMVKLKKPKNFNNPGSANYERTLSTRHIDWTGYVRNFNNQLLQEKNLSYQWVAFRSHLNAKLGHIAPDEKTAGLLEALTLNTTTHISQAQWELFRRTGTTHLFGISGEHIALISGLFFFLIKRLWSSCPRCCLRIPAVYIASTCSLLAATGYAFLAGFAPPVQRALAGCFFYTLYYLGKQQFSAWQIWRYALLIVLCIEPHAVFMQGFYFSFLAVACLLLTQQRWRLSGYKAKLALQISCLIGLMPFTLYWYSYGSINGFFANLFAIPLVGLLIMPLSLLTLCCSHFQWVWIIVKPLSWLTTILYQGLIWTEHLEFLNIQWAINDFQYVLAFFGGLLLWVLLPTKPFKSLSLLCLIVPFFPHQSEIHPGEALIHILDVGQGLSISVQTAHHVLLYDTGDQFFQGSDLGKMVILPFYKTQYVKKIDALVISHPDKDHRGGLKSIEEELPVTQLIVNDPGFYHRGLSCHEYPPWEWDGIYFRFFPTQKRFKNKNNDSCILQIKSSKGRILFTGDIEKEAEQYLVETYGSQLSSDLLILPHHGSKTSSSYRFLIEVNPIFAIASLGFDNRFHFPHQQTITSLQKLGIGFYRTDECGMVQIKFPFDKNLNQPQCYRS